MSPIDAVTGALMHFLWQGALVAAALALVLRALDRRGAAATARYGAAVVALLLMAILPVATAGWMASQPPATRGVAPAPGAAAAPAAPAATPAAVPAVATSSPVTSSPVTSSPVTSSPAAAARGPALPFSPFSAAWIFYTWLCGVFVLSLYHLAGLWQVGRMRRRGTSPAPERWRAVLDRLGRRLELTRPVRLLESSRIAVPTVAGWLAPVVLVPARAFTGLTPQQLEAVLAHELAHLRRRDHWVSLFQAVIETVLFYHPAVWWVSHRLRVEREHCCDDLAVSLTGDRLLVARALTELEGLRVPALRPAGVLAADGGSLPDRVRRLVGAGRQRADSSRRSRAWLAGLLALCLVGGGFLAVAAAAPGPEEALAAVAFDGDSPRAQGQSPANGGGNRGGAVDGSAEPRGRWTGEIEDDGVWIEISRKEDGGMHRSSFTLPADELVGLGSGSFELHRDAGTFHFEGSFDGRQPGAVGSGSFRFTGSPDYVRDLQRLGYPETTLAETFELALFDVSRDFVRELHGLGYDDMGLDGLVRFRIHGVSPEYIREMAALGYEGLSGEDLVSFRIHGVSPDYVRGLEAAGYEEVPAATLVAFRIHGVSPAWIGELAELGHDRLSHEDLLAFRIHGVSPDWVRELADLGYRNLSGEDLVAFRIHGVSPTYVGELRDVGFDGLTTDGLLQFRIHGVSPSFIEELHRDGHRDLTPEEVVGFKIHGGHGGHGRHGMH